MARSDATCRAVSKFDLMLTRYMYVHGLELAQGALRPLYTTLAIHRNVGQQALSFIASNDLVESVRHAGVQAYRSVGVGIEVEFVDESVGERMQGRLSKSVWYIPTTRRKGDLSIGTSLDFGQELMDTIYAPYHR